jgi:hypothetical protein
MPMPYPDTSRANFHSSSYPEPAAFFVEGDMVSFAKVDIAEIRLHLQLEILDLTHLSRGPVRPFLQAARTTRDFEDDALSRFHGQHVGDDALDGPKARREIDAIYDETKVVVESSFIGYVSATRKSRTTSSAC